MNCFEKVRQERK